MRKVVVATGIVGTALAGLAAGAMFFGPMVVAADTPSASPAATPAATSSTGSGSTTTTPNVSCPPGMMSGHGGPGGPGGRPTTEAVTDTSVAATAIGISESDLITDLNNGQTMADVAKANNVDPQKVIDALVEDGQQELAAAVQAGTLTQAQADSMETDVTQRVTDQVNGTLPAHPSGPGAPNAPSSTAQPTTTTPTS
jgi:hypothetical protein